MSKLHHIVLKIQKEDLQFHNELFKSLGLKEIYRLNYYAHYENDNMSVGLWFDKFEERNDKACGLGHIAFEVDKETIHSIKRVCSNFKTNLINLGLKKHHGIPKNTFEVCYTKNVRIEILY